MLSELCKIKDQQYEIYTQGIEIAALRSMLLHQCQVVTALRKDVKRWRRRCRRACIFACGIVFVRCLLT